MTAYKIEEILQHLENCNYIGAKEAIKLIHTLNQRRMALQQRVADLEDQVNNLQQWEKRHLDVIEAQKEYMKAQDKHIVDLAFKLVYAERGNEVAKELSK
jgi:hypothetical protein